MLGSQAEHVTCCWSVVWCCLSKNYGSFSNSNTIREGIGHRFAPWLPGKNQGRADAEITDGRCGTI